MLEEGRSYSGFERNNAFLHLGGREARFADVSGACGLDRMDDGRSIAVCDWDYDGRQDFWITNRTAPRVRLQHNRSQTPHSFLAVKLQGVACNRDAVGARVELEIEGSERKRIRTVRAGEGFLAQSSSWVHYGIAKGAKITGVAVRWPGGAREEFTGLQPGSFYQLTQGSRVAKEWKPPVKADALAESSPGESPAPVSEAARIVMASPLPLPEATYLALDGERTAIGLAGKPLLLNLWATWCAPCVAEMNSWTKEESALRELGLDILALSVDQPDEDFAARVEVVRPFLQKRKFPFPAGLADADFLEMLEVAGRAQLDKFDSFPIPSSILLDPQGRMSVIYKGPVEVDQLARDIALLDASREERHAAAAHFPGRWIDGPWPADPTTMIDKFMSFGNPTAARRYLDRFMARAGEHATKDLSDAYYLVGGELALQKNFPEAIKALVHAVRLNPAKTQVRLQLATLLFRLQRYREALPHLQAVIGERPQDHNTRKMLSLALSQTGDYAQAVPHFEYLSSLDPKDAMAKLWYGHALGRLGRGEEAETLLRAALDLQSNSLLVVNELAWLLATTPDDGIRKPKEALRLASAAAKASRYREPRVLDTLAAAQAARGQFEQALATIDRALQLAQSSGDQTAVRDLQNHRTLYLAGKPLRQAIPSEK